MFDTCDNSDIMQMKGNSLEIQTSGRFRLSLTALIKSGGNDPFTVMVKRNGKSIGEAKLELGISGMSPEIGLSTTVVLLQELERGDKLSIDTDSPSGRSYLRSSGWNLVRLAGDLVEEGAECTFTASTVICDNPSLVEAVDGKLLLKKSNLYDISMSGYLKKDSFGLSDVDVFADGSRLVSVRTGLLRRPGRAGRSIGITNLTLPFSNNVVKRIEAGTEMELKREEGVVGRLLFVPVSTSEISCSSNKDTKSKLVTLPNCQVNRFGAYDVESGVFKAPSPAVYKITFSGMFDVIGSGMVHSNILSKSGSNLNTLVAGFTKIGGNGDEEIGFELVSNYLITAYHMMEESEEVCLGMGRKNSPRSKMVADDNHPATINVQKL